MTKKTVTFAKPAALPTAEAWVAKRQPDPVPMKRFTVDVPAELHRRVKLGCVERGQNMTDLLRDLLEREFPVERTNP